MSEVIKTINEIMAAVPAASSLDGKSVVLTDAQGNMGKMDALGLKCHVLFGISNVVSRFREQQKSQTELSADINKSHTWWSEFKANDTPVGYIAVMRFPVIGSNIVASLYYLALDESTTVGNNQYRNLKPLLLEIPGYPQVWNQNA